ncbi:hypothetical protein [Phaeobacter sp. HF9A]|uniref:hypothetical protein n=1 Tax=Phaeobacter sp. HF9A TaxID=2721561 RepID=UPI0014312A85|nr:hypothetical protein [Phaeobacter sp. HF9A]NIZ13915.1 hypothetical protein [Phaeobacter sp. HF9A]
MAALTNTRNTPRLEGDLRRGAAGASALIYSGALVMRAADGFLEEGRTATGFVGVGRAEALVDNRQGLDGDENVPYRVGIFKYANSAGADEISFADVGQPAFIVDDQTVAKTDGTATRSPAGIIEGVEPDGVWIRFDEALTNVS